MKELFYNLYMYVGHFYSQSIGRTLTPVKNAILYRGEKKCGPVLVVKVPAITYCLSCYCARGRRFMDWIRLHEGVEHTMCGNI